MQLFRAAWVLTIAGLASVAGAAENPFAGNWDFNVNTPNSKGACWLGVTDKSGALEVWFQPTGGHVRQMKDVRMDGSRLLITLSDPNQMPATTWELQRTGNQLTGTQKRGASTTPLTGERAPELNRRAPAAWSQPEALFNGQNLDGWMPVGDVANSHWTVKDGVLVNAVHGANLRTSRTFEDFKVHFEVNCPDDANSGFYLRGRYEVQLEYEPAASEPKNRGMGSVYGRIAPSRDLPRKPGQWETFDVTLVGRTVSIVRDGVQIVDRQKIEGITGGALDANEGQPGPFYIQGDHTGGLQFRNITVAVPKP